MREIYIALQVVLIFMWPLTAYAARSTFEFNLFRVDPAAIAMALILSTMAGLTALLSQMKKDYEAHGTIDRLWLYISSKMFGSNTAGVAMYFGADTLNLGGSATAAAIIVAAFGGTWALERALAYASDKWLPSKGNA